MNKNIFIIIPCLFLLITSCQQALNTINYETKEEFEMKVNLDFEADIQTKVQGQTDANEEKVNNVQIFVFRSENGAIDACASSGYSGSNVESSITLKCTTGNREVWALVNYPRDLSKDQSIGNKTKFLEATSTLKEYSSNNLLMIGNNVPASFTAGNHEVQVKVYNAFASVILQSIRNDMQAPVYQAANKFRINKIYLTNVPGKINVGQTTDASTLDANFWYAKRVADNETSLLTDSLGEHILAFGSTYNTAHTFYTFPNPCPIVNAETWSARACRLVVEAEYNDGITWNKCYYPITLYNTDTNIGLKANTRYYVNLTIKRPGSSNPDKPVEFDTISGTVDIADWATGTVYSEEI